MSTSKTATAAPLVPSLPFLRTDTHGDVFLAIQVIPNAAKTQVDGLYGGPDHVALKVRLNAPPIDGKANEALIKWLADQLGISRKALEVVRGKTSRRKQLRLSAQTASKADWSQLTRYTTDANNSSDATK